jgi:hypothetical protein
MTIAFWTGSDRFYIRGVDYQPGGSSAMADPLADSTVCQRDIAEFKKLGINTVRVYITDNSVSHDTCMNALADANIYVILDANNPLYSINRYDPAPSYNAMYLQSVFATIDAFIKYPNTLAFFSGNEVINENISSTLAASYVKATTRDMRQYISNRKYRQVPVGYSAADVSDNRMQLAAYMNCGSDDERSDFFAFVSSKRCPFGLKTITDEATRTIIPGATPTLRHLAGTRRLRTLRVMACPFCERTYSVANARREVVRRVMGANNPLFYIVCRSTAARLTVAALGKFRP